MGKETFFYCVCGERHLRRVETSLRFLKRFSRADIVVVMARGGSITHDQTFCVDVPAWLTDDQACILLKTSLPRLVATPGVSCYIDREQCRVRSQVFQPPAADPLAVPPPEVPATLLAGAQPAAPAFIDSLHLNIVVASQYRRSEHGSRRCRAPGA